MPAERPRPEAGRQLSILLVGDHQVILHAMKTWLAPLGHRLTWVQNGLAALIQLRKQRFDIVVIDLDLASLDGTLICQCLRNSNDPATVIALGSRWYGDAAPGGTAAENPATAAQETGHGRSAPR